MRYKIGDRFPVRWNKDLFFEDGDFYIYIYGTATIKGKLEDVGVWMSNIFGSIISIPPLPDEGILEVIKIEDDYYVLAPEEWKDPRILAEGVKYFNEEDE